MMVTLRTLAIRVTCSSATAVATISPKRSGRHYAVIGGNDIHVGISILMSQEDVYDDLPCCATPTPRRRLGLATSWREIA